MSCELDLLDDLSMIISLFFLKILYAMGPWTVIYFLCIVLFGRFYLINLVLAVVAASYENEVQNAKQVTCNYKQRRTIK